MMFIKSLSRQATLAGAITFALLTTGCNEKPISPIGNSDSVLPERAGQISRQTRKVLDPSRMKLLQPQAPRALQKGHACSGTKSKLIKPDRKDNIGLCHEKLEFPTGAVNHETEISFAAVNDNLVELEISPDVTFNAAATLTLHLKVVNLIDVNMAALTISRYDAASDNWVDLPSSMDDKQENISANITQAGRYALTWNVTPEEKEFIAWQGENWGGSRAKKMQRSKGGRLEFHGHEMEVPPYALRGDFKMVITEVDKEAAQVDFGPSGNFDQPVKITICYKNLDTTGLDPSTFTITWWDPVTREWIDVGGTVDEKAKKVWVYVWHFTQYSLASR